MTSFSSSSSNKTRELECNGLRRAWRWGAVRSPGGVLSSAIFCLPVNCMVDFKHNEEQPLPKNVNLLAPYIACSQLWELSRHWQGGCWTLNYIHHVTARVARKRRTACPGRVCGIGSCPLVPSPEQSQLNISGTSYRLAKHQDMNLVIQMTHFWFCKKLYLDMTSEDFPFLAIFHLQQVLYLNQCFLKS